MNDNDVEKQKDGDYPGESPLDIKVLEEFHSGKGIRQNPKNCPTDS